MGNRYFREDGDDMIVGGGGGYGNGGFGGIGAIIALVVVVAILWFLAREGRGNNDGCNGGAYPYPPYAPYPYPPAGGNCNSVYDCRQKMVVDESVCELDKHITAELCKVDADLLKCCCEEKTAIHEEGEKTRALIEANYIQDLRDKLTAKDSEVQSLKTQQYTDSKFDALYGKLNCYDNDNDKQYNRLDNKIDALICNLDCNLPKRPPVYYKGSTVNTHDIDCRDDFPRRRGCNDGCGCDNYCA